MFRKLFITAGVAAVAAVGIAASAQAYVAPAGHIDYRGTTVVTDPTTHASTTIQNVDMNVQLDGTGHYHEYDLTYSPAVDGVITFTGVGKQYDNFGELITGSIDTTNHKVTWKSQYLQEDGTLWPGTSWGITDAPYIVDTVSGDLDWHGLSDGDQSGYAITGGFRNLPAAAPAPVAGNHGQYVSGAVKAGIKGKDLAAIAQNGNLTGPYTTS